MPEASFQFDTALIDPIVKMMDSGLNTLMIVILVAASFFAVTDLMFTAFFNWSETGNLLVETIKKLIRYSITFGLIKAYTSLLDMAYKLFSDIGNLFGSGLGSPLRIQSVWDNLWTEINKFLKVGMQFKDFWALLYFVLFIIGFVFMVFIIATMTMVIIQFHIVGRLAIIYLACLPLDVLSDIGRKTLGAIVGAGTQLMVAVALCSMGTAILKTVPIPENIGTNNNEPQTILAWLAVFVTMSFLILNYQQISSIILFGQGGVAGSQLGNFSGNVIAAGGGALGGLTSFAGSTIGSGLGSTAGAIAGGVTGGKAGAVQGMKKGSEIGSKIGKAPGKAISTTAENAGEAIRLMTMNVDAVAAFKKMKQATLEEKKKREEAKEKRKEAKEETEKDTTNDSSATGETSESAEATKKNTETAKETSNKSNNKKSNDKEKKTTNNNEKNSATSNKTADITEAEEKLSNNEKVVEKEERKTQTTENKIKENNTSNSKKSKGKKESNKETFVESEIRRERNQETFADAEAKRESNKETFAETDSRNEKNKG